MRRVTHFFYRFLIRRRYFATDFEWQALEFILSNVFSICVQNFSRITISTVIVLKIQLQIFFYKQTQLIQAGRHAISYWTPSRREKSRIKYKRAHEFYARSTHRANAPGVFCYVCYDLLRSMHDTLSRPKGTNALAKIPRIGWVYSNAALL